MATPHELLQRWFPGKSDEICHTILWNLTAYPAGGATYVENQLKWAAIRTMPELPGFETRLDEAMCEVLERMDRAHEEGKRREAEAGKT
jgi:hypothetical protein